jgi:hypothetical protein
VLIARRAETPITQVQLDGLKLYHQAWNEWDYRGPGDDECPFEWKTSDWGVFDGRLVAVDYGNGRLSNGGCPSGLKSNPSGQLQDAPVA